MFAKGGSNKESFEFVVCGFRSGLDILLLIEIASNLSSVHHQHHSDRLFEDLWLIGLE